jgi:hypothetical protein
MRHHEFTADTTFADQEGGISVKTIRSTVLMIINSHLATISNWFMTIPVASIPSLNHLLNHVFKHDLPSRGISVIHQDVSYTYYLQQPMNF